MLSPKSGREIQYFMYRPCCETSTSHPVFCLRDQRNRICERIKSVHSLTIVRNSDLEGCLSSIVDCQQSAR